MALRRKNLVKYGVPDYGQKHFLKGYYSIRIQHGGTLVEDGEDFNYIGGTSSVFDFVERDRCTIETLNTLCEQLGYMKKKVYYGLWKNGKMNLVEGTVGLEKCFTGAREKEVLLWLDAVKSERILVEDEGEVLGEVEFYTDEELMQLRTEVLPIPKIPGSFLSIEKNPDDLSPNYKPFPFKRFGINYELELGGEGEKDLEGEKGLEGEAEGGLEAEAETGLEGEAEGGLEAEVETGLEGETEGGLDAYFEDEADADGGLEGEAERDLAMIKYIPVEDDSDDSDDSLFTYKEDSGDDLLDDIIFEENVHMEVEWTGVTHGAQEADNDEDTSGMGSEEEVPIDNEDELDSLDEEDSEDGGKNVDRNLVFKPSQVSSPEFFLSQIFPNKQLFKDAVNTDGVQTARNLRFTKNDGRRIYARCKEDGCEWHINALRVKNEESYQIREYNADHTCARAYYVKNANSTWLAKEFEDDFRSDPNKRCRSWKRGAMKKLGVHISNYQAFRARQIALQRIEGDSTEQYGKLWDYTQALLEKNPGSTIILRTDPSTSGNTRFNRLYICLDAVKQGFRSGCRPWIGVDGCHLKGPNGGVLLTAVGMDPNNDPYPLAYVVVGSETREAWEWFLQLLKDDLIHGREDNYVFMSDKQKGLIPAFEKVLPTVDNRFCVRHLHGNMKNAGYGGDQFKKLLWAAAKTTNVPAFDRAMNMIGEKDPRLIEWLQDKPPSQWSRSHFSTFAKCDTLVNNMCEVFNGCILDARDKPIITMLEWVREFMMRRLAEKRDKCERLWEGSKVCGKIKLMLNERMKKSGSCMPIKSCEGTYEVSVFDGTRYAVNLKEHTCACREWELSGIPCIHAVSAICAQGEDVQDYVHDCYSVETYDNVYSHSIAPMNGTDLWAKTGYIPPLPPNFGKRKAGRPKKNRRKGADESGDKKKKGVQSMGRQKKAVKCKFCSETGHYQRGCKWKKLAEEFMEECGLVDEEGPSNKQNVPEEMTQEQDLVPPMTQEDELDNAQVQTERPTTMQGRKIIAGKRKANSKRVSKKERPQKTRAQSNEDDANLGFTSNNFIGGGPIRGSGSSTRQDGMTFNTNILIGGESGSRKLSGSGSRTQQDGMKITSVEGKNYVTQNSLTQAARVKRGKKKS